MNAYPAKQSKNNGFTLVEMMVVISVIVILLVIIGPALIEQGRRSAWNASCTSNLHQIGISRLAYREDHPSRPLQPGEWDALVDGYMQNNNQILRCPEETDLGIQNVNTDFEIAVWHRSRGGVGTPSIETSGIFIDFNSPFAIKVSQTQLDNDVTFRDRNNFWNLNPGYAGYIPDTNPNLFYIYFEENIFYPRIRNDMDHEDIRLRAEIISGQVQMDIMTQQSMYSWGAHTWLVRKGTRENMLGTEIPTTWTRFAFPITDSNYGMNWRVADRPDGGRKIFAIDYKVPVVDIATWSDWDSVEGIPAFARHPGNRVNMLTMDGAVVSAVPWDINPEFSQNEQDLWAP